MWMNAISGKSLKEPWRVKKDPSAMATKYQRPRESSWMPRPGREASLSYDIDDGEKQGGEKPDGEKQDDDEKQDDGETCQHEVGRVGMLRQESAKSVICLEGVDFPKEDFEDGHWMNMVLIPFYSPRGTFVLQLAGKTKAAPAFTVADEEMLAIMGQHFVSVADRLLGKRDRHCEHKCVLSPPSSPQL